MVASTPSFITDIAAVDPDAILVSLNGGNDDAFERVLALSRVVKRPMALFVEHSSPIQMEAALAAGVAAYVVGVLEKERIKSILDVSTLRFRAHARLQDELAETKAKLQQRETIDKAKRLLMHAKNLTEEEAYASMRRAAMNDKKRISDIAAAIVTAADLLR